MHCLELRARIHSQRNELRHAQHAISAADDRYIQCVRKREFGGLNVFSESEESETSSKTITELYDKCQRARDEYGPLEGEFNLLEDQLGREEFELDQMEVFYLSLDDKDPLQRQLTEIHLHPQYFTRTESSFFKPGKLFKILWTEPAPRPSTWKKTYTKVAGYKRKAVRMILNGKVCFAQPDSAAEDAMTEDFANENEYVIHRTDADKGLIMLGNGTKVQSIGRASARISPSLAATRSSPMSSFV